MNFRPFTAAAFVLLATILTSCTEKKKAPAEEKAYTSTITDGEFDPGEGWKLVWSDEFEGDSLNAANWNRQIVPAGQFNDEWQRYTADTENAYVSDGSLVIQAIHEGEEHGMNQYTSARLNTANKQSFKYGKIVARARLPYSEGIWPAFWMLGANIDENGGDTSWPQCGEIDIFELYGSEDNAAVEANLHYANASGGHANMGARSYRLDEGIFADDFHIFELAWDQEQVAWYVDGNEYASIDITSDEFTEFHEEFFILFNIATGGSFAGRPNESTVFPQYMYVDWVRVYQEEGA